MKSDTFTITLFVCHTAEGLAEVCRDHAKNVFHPCAVGWYVACPLGCPGDRQWCAKVEAKDWEAVMDAQTASEILKTLNQIEDNTFVANILLWVWFLFWFLWRRE